MFLNLYTDELVLLFYYYFYPCLIWIECTDHRCISLSFSLFICKMSSFYFHRYDTVEQLYLNWSRIEWKCIKRHGKRVKEKKRQREREREREKRITKEKQLKKKLFDISFSLYSSISLFTNIIHTINIYFCIHLCAHSEEIKNNSVMI